MTSDLPSLIRLRSDLEPGQFVTHPGRPEWGMGQVQSAIGARVTVNFEHAGKQLVNAAVVTLIPLGSPTGAS